MIIKVGINEISVAEQDLLNAGEYNIHECNFVFDEVYDGLVKKAVFSNKLHSYQVSILNDKCIIPYEVLQEKAVITIGVYAYEVQDEELIMRYSPKPCTKYIDIGSYKEHYDNYEEVTPTDKEQMEQAIQEMETKVDNLDIDANKVETTTTITITKKDGTTKEVEVLDGVGINYNWQGTSLGIKRENEQDYEYVNLKGDTGEPGQIEFIVVTELPQTGREGTIYLVPLPTPDSQKNNFAEYIWVNSSWELLGKIGVRVDLSNYYTKQETNILLNGKQATIDNLNKLSSDLVDDTNSGNKFVTTTEKQTWNNKLDESDLTDYVKNTDYATTTKAGVITGANGILIDTVNGGKVYGMTKSNADYNLSSNTLFISKGTLENVITGKELVNKTYVDTLVGDIETILETLDVGNGV